MDYTDKQLDAMKTLSRLIAITIAGIVGVSIYLIQRGIASLLGLLDPMSYKSQIGYAGLNLVYATMTFIWPIFLGIAFLLLRVLVAKRDSVMNILVADTPPSAVLASDPWCFVRDRETKTLAVLIWLIRLLPLFAIVVVFLSFVYTTLTKLSIFLRWPDANHRGVLAWAAVAGLMQLAGTLFGLRCVTALWASIYRLWIRIEMPAVQAASPLNSEAVASDDC